MKAAKEKTIIDSDEFRLHSRYIPYKEMFNSQDFNFQQSILRASLTMQFGVNDLKRMCGDPKSNGTYSVINVDLNLSRGDKREFFCEERGDGRFPDHRHETKSIVGERVGDFTTNAIYSNELAIRYNMVASTKIAILEQSIVQNKVTGASYNYVNLTVPIFGDDKDHPLYVAVMSSIID